MQAPVHGLALLPLPPPFAAQVPSIAGLRNVPDTVTVAKAAAPPHVTVYVVVTVGDTVTAPETAFAVENPVPVHDDAFCESQVNTAEPPFGIVDPANLFSALVADKYEPLAPPTAVATTVCNCVGDAPLALLAVTVTA